MIFNIIDLNSWSRKEHFEHYISATPCTYSLTVKLDITNLKASGRKLYPAMLYYLSKIVNRHDEFRMSLDESNRLGCFTTMLPSYTIFHPESETFSNLWTEWSEDYETFYNLYQQDLNIYGSCQRLHAKPHTPAYAFSVSMLPWTSFDGFNLNLSKGYTYLAPIFTIGKYYEENGKCLLPLSIQVHHAVCDGFHVCRFINELQTAISK